MHPFSHDRDSGSFLDPCPSELEVDSFDPGCSCSFDQALLVNVYDRPLCPPNGSSSGALPATTQISCLYRSRSPSIEDRGTDPYGRKGLRERRLQKSLLAYRRSGRKVDSTLPKSEVNFARVPPVHCELLNIRVKKAVCHFK